jgi:predicted sulfurtransferase
LLETVPDDTVILIPGNNHDYYEVSIGEFTTALYDKLEWFEDFGNAATPEEQYGVRIPVFVVSA